MGNNDWQNPYTDIIELKKRREEAAKREAAKKAKAAQPPMPEEHKLAWVGELGRSQSGAFYPTVANALIIIENDPALTGMLSYNAMTHEALINRAPPDARNIEASYPRVWDVTEITLVQSYIQRIWAPKFARETIGYAMQAIAECNPFHPILDWLATLKWDGVPRLDGWLSKIFGCADDDYHAAVGSKFPIAAVRRVRFPGCKFDQMPIFEGPQNIGKSTALRDLFGVKWFSDSIPADLGSKDAAMAVFGPWCIELAEIDALIRSETETVKAFLSRQVERFRLPYGRNVIARPRQCVLAGTTNSDDYLRDSTGNRRFWPIACKFVDLDALAGMREQLWAEAAVREAAGEEIWLNEAVPASLAREHQASRLPQDAWETKVAEWLIGKTEVIASEALGVGCLDIPTHVRDRRALLRVTSIFRALGWTSHVTKTETRNSKRVWKCPDE